VRSGPAAQFGDIEYPVLNAVARQVNDAERLMRRVRFDKQAADGIEFQRAVAA